MMLSVFTPVHKYKPKQLLKLQETLDINCEWVVLLNGDALKYEKEYREILTKATIYTTDKTGNIGFLKAMCCELAKGEILVEVDYDDYLLPKALLKVRSAFLHNSVQYVYSNSINLREDGTCQTFNEVFGWKSKEFGNLQQVVKFPPLPHALRRIEYSPNHIRAFRKSAYVNVGGYNKTLDVCDDHELLCKFYVKYGSNGFFHINEPLYIYNIHDENTCYLKDVNKKIQILTDNNYIKYGEQMFLKWAGDKDLLALDLGGRLNSPKKYLSVDLFDADIIQDLEKPWDKIQTNSVGVLRAYHVLEHLHDSIHFFNEAYRVLAPGGLLQIEVPSIKGDGAFADPTHVKFFNKLSFEYYTNQKYAQYIQPQYKGRFQNIRCVEYWWNDPKIPVISCHMIALKGWYDENFIGLKKI